MTLTIYLTSLARIIVLLLNREQSLLNKQFALITHQ